MNKFSLDSAPILCNIQNPSLKSDIFSMEHPIFALDGKSKASVLYNHKGINIEIEPSIEGRATIKDKKIIIYCLSQIIAKINYGYTVSDTIHVKAYELLQSTQNGTSGKHYQNLRLSLRRLAGTRIITNPPLNEETVIHNFTLIDSYKVIGTKNNALIEIRLSQWLFRSIRKDNILTLPAIYRDIGRPICIRIYEICRKFCGHQAYCIIGIENLKLRLGSKSSLSELRRQLKQIIIKRKLPGYRIQLVKNNVHIYNRSKTGNCKLTKDIISGKVKWG